MISLSPIHCYQYEGYLQIILTHLVCSNFIIFRLNIKTTASSIHSTPRSIHRCQLLVSFRMAWLHITFFKCAAIPLKDNRLCSFLTTVKAPYPVTVTRPGAFSSQIADNRRWISDGLMLSFHRNPVAHLCPWQSPYILRLLSMPFDH
jgi:hypothetical protein